jgi:hypothetical protein
MADVPTNQKLWNMFVIQARSKFAKWPSLPASKWVHNQYTSKGGQFISEGQLARMQKASKRPEKKTGKDKKDSK